MKFQQSVKTLTAVRAGIQSIFNRLGCNTQQALEAVGGTQGVTEANMLKFMGMIEQKTNEIVQVYQTLQETGDDAEENEKPAPNGKS